MHGPHFLGSKVLKVSYAFFSFFFLVWHIRLYKNVKSIVYQNHVKLEDNEFGKHICNMHIFCINFLLLHKKLPSYTFQVSETLTWKTNSWNGLQMLITRSSFISNHSYSSTISHPSHMHIYTPTIPYNTLHNSKILTSLTLPRKHTLKKYCKSIWKSSVYRSSPLSFPLIFGIVCLLIGQAFYHSNLPCDKSSTAYLFQIYTYTHTHTQI